MDYQKVAAEVLSHIGDAGNVDHVMTCLTRLRIGINNMDLVEFDELRHQQGVLGVVTRNHNEVEVVFGPASIEGIGQAFAAQAHLELEQPEAIITPLTQLSPNTVAQNTEDEPDFDESRPKVAPVKRADPNYIISPGRKQSFRTQQQAALDSGRLADEDIDSLRAFLASNEVGPQKHIKLSEGKAVLVLNGPNLNMLGVREPALYGKEDYTTLVRLCKAAAQEAGFADIRCFQTNHEGSLVDEIQNALGVYDGIIINPGAYTHTSVAILDAVKAVNLPCVEVHISKVEEREDFRQVSYIRKACFETITGLGIEGYRKAILDLAAHLGM